MATTAKIDPELVRQIQETKAAEPLQAVLRLCPEADDQVVVSPERTEQIVQTVLQRVSKKIGAAAADTTIFRNLGSFAISASSAFLQELIAQPEIAAATANRRQEKATVPALNRREVDLKEIGKERASGGRRKVH